MKKINRRDYLLQMGAGAVGVMSSAPLDVLAESLRPSARAATPPQPNDLRWIPTPNFPTHARVTVIFGGLFGFFYTDEGICEIGAHKGEPRHRLMVEVWEKPSGGSCRLFLSTQNGTLEKPNQKIEIQIVGRGNDVKCYQVGAYNRKNLVERDFRWLPDLDSGDFYAENYPKHRAQFKVKSILKHGTLYTYQRSSSTFTRVHPSDNPNQANDKDFYHVAEYMAAGIQPTTTEDVSLQIDGHNPVVLPRESVYQIIILNHCYKNEHGHDKCDFEPTHPLEIKRNDFHHVRNVLQLPNSRERYGLKRKDRGASSPTFCPGSLKESTDEAPCMGAAFGKTRSMP